MRWILPVLLACTLNAPCAASVYSGKVVGIQDGDTCTIYDGKINHRVRLAGIDAPEKAQDFGEAAKKNLSSLIFQKEVTVDVESHDRYRREIGWITRGAQRINRQQVVDGFAWMYRRFTNDPELNQAEEDAKQAHLGLWQKPGAIPPWDFRHGTANSETAPKTENWQDGLE